MSLTHFYLALVIGICLSLLVEEVWGINSGGSICPGFFAMVCDDLPTVCLIVVITMLDVIVVKYILPKFVVLYGKRRFAAVLICSVIFKLAFEQLWPLLPFAVVMFRGIGVMSTGVLANNCIKQGFKYTLPACAAVTAATYFIVQLISMTGVI